MRLFIFLLFLMTSLTSLAQNYYLFIGTYTGEGSKGIYVYRFNAQTGAAQWVSNTDSVANPSYLAVAPGGNYLYAVNETGGNQPGGVSAFAFNKASGALTLLNQQPSGGDHPCYITTSPNGKWVLVGNYSGGNLAALPISANGQLHPPAQLIQHTGNGANAARQEKAHVHATVLSPDGQYLFTPDLGTDKVMIYRFNAGAQKPLQPAQPPFIAAAAGSGPRHLTFHPNKKYAYVIEELSGTVAAYRYHRGRLTFLHRIGTHPADYKGSFGSADIHLSPDGKFLYASNRGDANSITIFSVAPNGRLKWKGYQPAMGVHPRNFTIDPTGNFVLVANRDTDNIVIFKRSPQTGLLRYTGNQIKISSPVFVQLLKMN